MGAGLFCCHQTPVCMLFFYHPSLNSKIISEHVFGGVVNFRKNSNDSIFDIIDKIDIPLSGMRGDFVCTSYLKKITRRMSQIMSWYHWTERWTYYEMVSSWCIFKYLVCLDQQRTSIPILSMYKLSSHIHNHDDFNLIHLVLLNGVF